MFKNKSCSDELFESMAKNLNAPSAEQKIQLNKLAKTINYLSNAAMIFEKVGMKSEAAEIINVLESLVKK